jgi:hypothetical protein
MVVGISMIPTSKQSASVGSLKAIVRRVTLAPSPTILLPTMHPLVSTSKRPAATTTTAASLMFGSTPQLLIARLLVYWDTVNRARIAPSCMHTSVPIFPIRVLVPMVTNVDWVTYIVRLECGKPLALRRISKTLQIPRPGSEGLSKTLTILLNRSILFHSMLTIELRESIYYQGENELKIDSCTGTQ